MTLSDQTILRKLQQVVQERFNPPPDKLTDLHSLRQYFQMFKSWENIAKCSGIPAEELLSWYRNWFKRRIQSYMSDADLYIIKTELANYLINHDEIDDELLNRIRPKMSHQYQEVQLVKQLLYFKNQMESMFQMDHDGFSSQTQVSRSFDRSSINSTQDFRQKPSYSSFTNTNTQVPMPQSRVQSSLLSIPVLSKLPPAIPQFDQLQSQGLLQLPPPPPPPPPPPCPRSFSFEADGYFGNSFYHNAQCSTQFKQNENNMLYQAQQQQIEDANTCHNQTYICDNQLMARQQANPIFAAESNRRQGFVLPKKPDQVCSVNNQSFQNIQFSLFD